MSTKWTATGGRGTEHAVFDEASRIVGFVDGFEPKDLATALAAPEMLAMLRRFVAAVEVRPIDPDALTEVEVDADELLARIDGEK